MRPPCPKSGTHPPDQLSSRRGDDVPEPNFEHLIRFFKSYEWTELCEMHEAIHTRATNGDVPENDQGTAYKQAA